MSEPFVAEVRMWACDFAPRGWAMCDGQLLSIAQHTALYSLVGTTYGGDGRNTMGLPNLQGRVAMHPGSGPGLTSRMLGALAGVETVTLNANQIPTHSHNVVGDGTTSGQTNAPADAQPVAQAGRGAAKFYGTASPGNMKAETVLPTGGGQAHNNLQPYQVVLYTIALTGLYPSRN
jgi:microcystin-dependent protein